MSTDQTRAVEPGAEPLPAGLLSAHPWLTFLLPFIVFILFGALEPKPPDPGAAASGSSWAWLGLDVQYRHYPHIYILKIAATVAAMVLVLPGYRTFPLHVSWLALGMGLAGGLVWIGLSVLRLEARLLDSVGLGGILKLEQRSAFNPLEQLHGAWAYGFLAVRFVGLVAVVPVIEEFFLRGFLMRYVTAVNWWKLPFGEISGAGLVAGTVVPMLYHPEILAALVWFSAISYLMLKTRNIWDCVCAHAVTNLVLGAYVVASGQWYLM